MHLSTPTSLTSIKRANHGASLLEYSLLVGLIAVVSIGSVIGLGMKVSNTFSTTTDALSTNLKQAPIASGPIQYVGDFSAGRSAGGFGEYIGLMSASNVGIPIGTKGPDHDPAVLDISIYESGSGVKRTTLKLAGDTSESMPSSSTVTCTGLGSISFSEGSESVQTDHTIYNWDGHRFAFVSGNSYDCVVTQGD